MNDYQPSFLVSEYFEKILDSVNVHHIETFKTTKFNSQFLIKRLPKKPLNIDYFLFDIFYHCLINAVEAASAKFATTKDLQSNNYRIGFLITSELFKKPVWTPMVLYSPECMDLVIDSFRLAAGDQLDKDIGPKGILMSIEICVVDRSILPRNRV